MSSQSRQQKISTSTPKSSSKKSSKKAGDSSGDESSATLRSLLGVSPVGVKPSIPAKPGGRRKLKEKEELLINMVNQAKEREVCGKRNAGERGSMNSSVNTLSLQEVIDRVAKPEVSNSTRARSYSACEVNNRGLAMASGESSPQSRQVHTRSSPLSSQVQTRAGLNSSSSAGSPQLRPSPLFPADKRRASPGFTFRPKGGASRESTPESDAGYGTSLNMSASPDHSLAELVRAMKLKSGGEEGLKEENSGQHQLPSIVETDPAVAQAVRSAEPFYPQPMMPQGPNLLQTLFGLPSMSPSDPRQHLGGHHSHHLGGHHGQYIPTHHLPPFPAGGPLPGAFHASADPFALERAAKQYRTAASVSEAACTWSGQLPAPGRSQGPPLYSSKVFLGGVPWDLTDKCLSQAFRQFGTIKVEWPGKGRGEGSSVPKGYVYVVLEGEGAVPALLSQCTVDYSGGGGFYFRLTSRRSRAKEVQVIPWLLSDSNFVRCSSQRLDPSKTVFVGALHGVLTAEGLAQVFADLFGGVVYAGIDTDRFKYPIGSGRVTFSNTKSYMKAVAAAFIEIKTVKFTKKVQVDPYLEDALCSCCLLRQGPYFCRDLACFNYFCRACWELQHGASLPHHRPIMRNTRGGGNMDRPVEPVMGMLSSPAY